MEEFGSSSSIDPHLPPNRSLTVILVLLVLVPPTRLILQEKLQRPGIPPSGGKHVCVVGLGRPRGIPVRAAALSTCSPHVMHLPGERDGGLLVQPAPRRVCSEDYK